MKVSVSVCFRLVNQRRNFDLPLPKVNPVLLFEVIHFDDDNSSTQTSLSNVLSESSYRHNVSMVFVFHDRTANHFCFTGGENEIFISNAFCREKIPKNETNLSCCKNSSSWAKTS